MALILLLLAGQSVVVRIETDGVRVGKELIEGDKLVLRAVGRVPVRVSGDVVQNASTQGSDLEIAIAAGDRRVTLGAGVRITRLKKGFKLSTVGGDPLVIENDALDYTSKGNVTFTLTAKGFEFKGLGSLEGPSFSVRPK